MLFYEFQFLVFSIVLLACLAVVSRNEGKKFVLLVASYVFYMCWNPAFILLILFSTFVDYLVGRRMAVETEKRRRRRLLIVSLAANLGLLGYFKYAGFLGDSLLWLLRSGGFEPSWTTINVLLPVGISFYTFQTLSYTIDLYRGQIPPSRSPLDFALFVAFFPQLVAGPIVRAADFLPQLDHLEHLRFRRVDVFYIGRGLLKKVVVADNVALFADAIFANPEAWPSVVIWLATLSFGVQIYCDFSGYSDIAIGIAGVLGYRLPKNFDAPYFAHNPSDFWRRWHISLSSWLRDYLYISLGGNRGSTFATYRNLMLTMLLGGLWHGASWNFVLWGFLHGLLLIVHRAYSGLRARSGKPIRDRLWKNVLSIAAMQYYVFLTWVTFRLTDFDKMQVALSKFVFFDFDFQLADRGLGNSAIFSSLFVLGIFMLCHGVSVYRRGDVEARLERVPASLLFAGSVVGGFAAVVLWPLEKVPFIYFQF
ncbi:MAG: MBOAT family O-acyltransferase [Myxococcota bacterium]|jgi:D-alanyl-lipoteichoic acid acyltransferase DltB (MBOAT superfamily)|nr:MBOAT family O-acyltransferase [Myxococcota bacterium]